MTSITYPKLKYRLVRNRRILFVSGALAGFGGMLSILIGPSTTFFNDPMVFTTFLGLWLLAMATLVVRYPNNWMDPVGLSLALVPFIAATPVYEMLLTLPTGDRLVLGALWMIFLVSFGWFFTYLGFISLAGNLMQRVKLGECRQSGRAVTDLKPDLIVSAFFPRPNASSALRTSGPVDDDGFFEVTHRTQMPSLESFELEEQSFTYRVKILEQTAHSIVSLSVLEQTDGTFTSSVEKLSVRTNNGQTIFEQEEVHDHFDLLSGIGYWLSDFATDSAIARLEELSDRPRLANRFAPWDSLLTSMAQYFKSRETDPHSSIR